MADLGWDKAISECLKIVGIHEFAARQAVRAAGGPKQRQQALAVEAAFQAATKDIRALVPNKQPLTSDGETKV
jgi:hypothetical protein